MLATNKKGSMSWKELDFIWKMKRHFQQFPGHQKTKDAFGQEVCVCGFAGE